MVAVVPFGWDLAAGASAEALVPADLPGIWRIATVLRAHAAVLEQTGMSLGRIEVSGWRGSAARGFDASIAAEPARWWAACAAFVDGAIAMESYAASVPPARDLAEEARRLYRLSQLSRSPLDLALTEVDVGNVPQDAAELLDRARRAVAEAGVHAAEALHRAVAAAPEARRFWEATIRPAGAEESAHLALDAAGMVPVVGAAPDITNAGWYAAEGRAVEAALSAVSAVPGPGDVVGAGVLGGRAVGKVAMRELDRTAALLEAAKEVELGRGALAATRVTEGPGRLLSHVPYGFTSRQALEAFSAQANGALARAGVTDAAIYLRGSATTGIRYKTGESIAATGPGDLDLAIASPELLKRAQDLGVPLRSSGTRSAPMDIRHLTPLDLVQAVEELTATAGRPVSIMVYRSEDAIVSRGDAILLR